ncbi:MAG: hypothetical protein PHH04_07335 [Thomasclavelia sp.]|nr:hypothetical protein [Thomasclavelia sp.]
MAIVKTHLYNISFNPNDLMKVLIKIDNHKEDIFPQESKKIVGNVKGVSTMDSNNPYNDSLDRLYHIFDKLQMTKVERDSSYEEISIEHIEDVLENIETRIEKIDEVKENLITEQEENKEGIKVLNHLLESQVSLDDLDNTKYVTIRFGKVPISDYQKIKYYKDYKFIWHKLSETKHHVWLVYCGLTRDISEIDNVLYSMNFDETKVPDFAHGGILQAKKELEEEAEAMDKYIQTTNDKLNEIKNEYEDTLNDLFKKVSNLKYLYDQCKYVVDFSSKNAVYAFSTIPYESIKEMFKDVKDIKIMELPTDIYENKKIIAPVITRNNKLFSPFEKLFTPQPGDRFDPATIIGLIILITSFILIGDIGVGLIILVIGALLLMMHKSKFAGILTELGVAITLGGFLTGTVLYEKQLYSPIFELTHDVVVRIMMGMGIILIGSILVIIVKKITRKKYD